MMIKKALFLLNRKGQWLISNLFKERAEKFSLSYLTGKGPLLIYIHRLISSILSHLTDLGINARERVYIHHG